MSIDETVAPEGIDRDADLLSDFDDDALRRELARREAERRDLEELRQRLRRIPIKGRTAMKGVDR